MSKTVQILKQSFKIFLTAFLCLVFLNSFGQETNRISGADQNFDWLLGEWIRTNEKSDRNTYENWIKQSDTLYLGIGYTLQNSDTLFKEEIHLLKSAHEWIYRVYGVNRRPTSFRVTHRTLNSFVCQNDKNPFPKLISYTLEDDILTAEISADGKKIRFLFEQYSSDSK